MTGGGGGYNILTVREGAVFMKGDLIFYLTNKTLIQKLEALKRIIKSNYLLTNCLLVSGLGKCSRGQSHILYTVFGNAANLAHPHL